MGPDAEESLTHDDERRNVEDEVRGQIMKVQPVVEHKTMDEWMEGKPLSAEDAEAEARRKAGLAELEKLLSRLTDKEGISAKDIVYETVQVLTDKGKMDPIVAAVLQNVSFPGA